MLEVRGEGLDVGNDDECVVFVLELYPVRQRAHIMPEMKRSGRPVAREYSFLRQ